MTRTPRPKCVACGKPFRPAADEPYHSQACARLLLQRILLSVPGVVELLPRGWRKDLDAATPGARESLAVPHRLADREEAA